MGIIADVIDPVTRQRYDRDPRYIATKAEMYLASSGVGDEAMFGAEAEFFVFDNVSFDQSANHGFYYIDSDEGRWNSGRRESNLGYRPRYREGYFPVPPTDHHQDLRTEILLTMQECGLDVESHHHEVASGGQGEIDLHYNSLLRTADAMMLYKYIVRNVARQHGKTATFMPKPLFQDNGSSMHTHQSLVEGRQAAVFRRWLRRTLRDCSVVYRRSDQARPRAGGADGTHHQQLQAPLLPDWMRRSTWHIRAATARQPAEFPCTPRRRRPSASSIVRPIPVAIPTLRFQPC